MLDLRVDARRGSFHLHMECRLASDWTVIFGPSGAGKSSLLRLVAGLNGPGPHTNARILLDAEALTDSGRGLWVRPGHRHTAMVMQQPALFPHMSVEANIAYGLRALDHGARRARVQEMLELVGAASMAGRVPRDLSGGEAQRVALARALAPLPRLLLLDEPFSALDGVSSDALLERLQVWARAHGMQTLMATHDVTDALATGAEVALLHAGRLTALGPAAEVLAGERQRIAARLN